MKIYLPEKVIFSGGGRKTSTLLRVDKSFCLPKLKSITVVSYDFSTLNDNFLLSLLLLNSCST